MEQDQFHVSFSLRSKLLLSVILLLLVVIVFLILSSFVLFRGDNVAYVYEVQSKEAVLGGKEFVNITRSAIDTLRQALGTIDPRRPVSKRAKSNFENLVKNQSQLLGIRILIYNPKREKTKTLALSLKQKELRAASFQPEQFQVKDSFFKASESDLRKLRVSYFNLSGSQKGFTQLLGIALADIGSEKKAKGLPIALGFVPLSGFLNETKVSNLTIADHNGTILFDTNPERQFGSSNDITQSPLFQAALSSQLSNGALEFSVLEEPHLGSFFKPGLNLYSLSRTPVKEAMKSTYMMIGKIVLLGFIAVAGGLLFSYIFAKSLTAPLNRLYQATKQVASGKFDLRLRSNSKDEIGALSQSFNVMSNKISDLIDESMEKVRIEGELAIASTVQQTLIPPPQYRDNNLIIQSYYESASECGGDWWGFFTHANRAAIFIADATGHGLPSALITATARSCFSVLSKQAEDDPNFSFSPSKMLSFANRAVHDAATGQIMMTFFASVIDFSNMTLTYSSAGHNPPWLFQKTPEGYKMKSLVARGTRLGESSNLITFEEKRISIGPEDILFLYTDGIMEGKNKLGVQYGKKQMRKIMESSVVGGPELVVSSLVKDFKRHNEEKPLDDDITMAAAMILPNQGAHA